MQAERTPAPPQVAVLLTGPSMMGKTYLLERVLAIRFNVVTQRIDATYGYARAKAGLAGEQLIRHPELLRNGAIPPDSVGRFFEEYDKSILRTLERSVDYGVTPVFEGHTLRIPDEAERVASLVRSQLGPDSRVVRLSIELPYDDWVENILSRGEAKGKRRHEEVQTAIDGRAAQYRRRYEELTAPIEPVDGIEDISIAGEDDLVAMSGDLGLTRHRWYQEFTIGPIRVDGISDAEEKADTVLDEDVKGMDVLDVCCATGVVGMLLKGRGARSVIGIERMKERYVKCEELRKVLARQAGQDMEGVRFYGDDIFRLVPTLEPIDTVVALGILHYFEDYEAFLKLFADKTRRAMYIEVLRPDLLDDYGTEEAGAPAANGLIPYTRREGGTTKWAAPGPTLERIFAEALPDFELLEQRPTKGLGRSGPDTSRQIWRLLRRSGKAAPASPRDHGESGRQDKDPVQGATSEVTTTETSTELQSDSRPPVVQIVDPAKINLIYGGPNPREMMLRKGGTLAGDWDQEVADKGFTDTLVYRGIKEHHEDGTPWADTVYHKLALRRAKREVEVGRIESSELEARIAQRLESTDELYRSMKESGYKTQEDLGVTALANEIRVAITREGRYLFIDGRHRLAIARVLGLTSVPVTVVARHPEWEEFRDGILSFITHDKRRGRVYQRIDHPDLTNIPAAHDQDRLPVLLESLEGFDPAGKRLLDIGTHWGHMAQQMDRLGFDCTGVEAEEESAVIAKRIQVASEGGYRIVHGNIFDFPEVETFDVIFALNIFHHFLKAEETYRSLIELLHRFRASVVYFEPHKFRSKALANAYRNYEPQEFAEFVAKHAQLSNVETLGQAADGRMMFKLST